MHGHLPRLSETWSSLPIYFITVCTYHRKPILANDRIANILIDEWKNAYTRHGWLIGRYVIMPDHVHFFSLFYGEVGRQHEKEISGFMQQWKQWTSKRIIRENKNISEQLSAPIWQKEFFDHLLRSEESYNQKWEYVFENPIRKNLVERVEDWPWKGEIFDLSL